MVFFSIVVEQVDVYFVFVVEFVDEVCLIVLFYFCMVMEFIVKFDDSFVMVVDCLIEVWLWECILVCYFLYGIYGEEMGVKQGDVFIWVIDFIDGIKSFIIGFLLFGMLIGLICDCWLFCGLIDIFVIGE